MLFLALMPQICEMSYMLHCFLSYRIKENLWPQIPNPGESTIGTWSPHYPLKVRTSFVLTPVHVPTCTVFNILSLYCNSTTRSRDAPHCQIYPILCQSDLHIFCLPPNRPLAQTARGITRYFTSAFSAQCESFYCITPVSFSRDMLRRRL